MTDTLKKQLILNLPYLIFVYLFDKFCQGVRLAPGADASEKLLHIGQGFSAAFASLAPSFHLVDLCVGAAGAVLIRLAVYSKGKNAKKYRRGIEFGSARWGSPEDIRPYVDPVFENNVLLTQTERLTMSSRPKEPKYARNKNVVVLLHQIRETENSLSLLIGDQAHSIARGKLENQSLPATFSTGVGIQLLNNRADVHAAEMNLAQCFYGIETARSKFYPSITISGTGAFTNSAGAGIVNPGKWLLSAVGSLVQPIFQNGRIIAGLKVAKMQYEQAYNTWQNAVLKAGSEVSNALVLYNYSDEKGKVEAKRIAVLEQNVEDTRKLMSEAGGSYLEVIQAQSSLLNVQLSKVADDFYKMQAVVNLYYALGGGAK